jgi:DNA modification methylase
MNENEIILGNCIDVMQKLDGKIFDVAFTSPPYNRKRNDTYARFNDVTDNYYKLLCDVTDNLLRLTKGNVIINIQSNMYNKSDVAKWQGLYADKLKGVVIWTKENPCPSWNYKKDKDVFSVTNSFEYFFILGEDVQDFEANNKILNYIHSTVNTDHFEGHGAVMKLEIAEFFIRNFTKKSDFVFDPFMGMGTTAVACIHNKRNWGGVEIIPEYKERAEKRIQLELEQSSLFEDSEIEMLENQQIQQELF